MAGCLANGALLAFFAAAEIVIDTPESLVAGSATGMHPLR